MDQHADDIPYVSDLHAGHDTDARLTLVTVEVDDHGNADVDFVSIDIDDGAVTQVSGVGHLHLDGGDHHSGHHDRHHDDQDDDRHHDRRDDDGSGTHQRATRGCDDDRPDAGGRHDNGTHDTGRHDTGRDDGHAAGRQGSTAAHPADPVPRPAVPPALADPLGNVGNEVVTVDHPIPAPDLPNLDDHPALAAIDAQGTQNALNHLQAQNEALQAQLGPPGLAERTTLNGQPMDQIAAVGAQGVLSGALAPLGRLGDLGDLVGRTPSAGLLGPELAHRRGVELNDGIVRDFFENQGPFLA